MVVNKFAIARPTGRFAALALALSLTASAVRVVPAFAAPGSPSAKMVTGAQIERAEKRDTTAKAIEKTLDKSKDAKPADSKAAPAKADDKKEPVKAADKKEPVKPAPEIVIENVVNVPAENLVEHANEYLNKNVRFVANFHAYSALALDYKPALRPAKTNLSFLVLRNNSKVPLSELKLAMAIPKEGDKSPQAVLITELKEGDQLEITGKVFAVALDEPWVDVLKIKRLKAAADDKDKKASSESSTSK